MTRLTKTSPLAASRRRARRVAGAPMMLVSAVNAGTKTTIEAPTQGKKGLGLVLLVSLQRA